MCDYPKFIEQGWQIDYSHTEAMYKVLTYRLKVSGSLPVPCYPKRLSPTATGTG
jgi:hypothetical protein